MLTDPRVLPASASAQEAGALLARPEVKAVLVVDQGELVGLVTADCLVQRVVAAGLDPRATHLGDVAEPEQLAVRANGEVADRLDRIERTAGAQVDAVAGGLETAGGSDRVLRFEHALHVGETHAERGELGVGQLDVDLLVLAADQLHLGHVRHAQQLELDALGIVAQLRVVVAVAGECVDVAEGVAEFVVEERALHAGRQGVANVADLLAHLVEHLGHARRRQRILEHHEHLRFAGARVAA
jgi:CBS domain-containing protein